jgi:hypothetical protein
MNIPVWAFIVFAAGWGICCYIGGFRHGRMIEGIEHYLREKSPDGLLARERHFQDYPKPRPFPHKIKK